MNNSQPANILTAISYGTSGLVGFFGNAVLINIIIKNIDNSEPYEKIILATLLTDLCMCFNFAFLQPYGIIGHVTTFCKAAGFLFAFFVNMNQIWIAINMFSRYLALYNQEKYIQLSKPRGILLCYCFVIMTNTPVFVPLIYKDVFGLNNVGVCAGNPINTITTICSLSGQAITMISNIVCFVFGYFIIKKIQNHVSQVDSSFDSGLVKESRQIVILVTVLAIIPILFQTPNGAMKFAQYFMTINPWVSRALASFCPLVPASTPYITAFIIKPYRKKVMKLFSKGCKTTTANVVRLNIVQHM